MKPYKDIAQAGRVWKLPLSLGWSISTRTYALLPRRKMHCRGTNYVKPPCQLLKHHCHHPHIRGVRQVKPHWSGRPVGHLRLFSTFRIRAFTTTWARREVPVAWCAGRQEMKSKTKRSDGTWNDQHCTASQNTSRSWGGKPILTEWMQVVYFLLHPQCRKLPPVMAPILRLQLLAKIQHPEFCLSIEAQTWKTNKTIHFGQIHYIGNSVATCVLLLVC